ncbi:MAG TPA: hypothetical protein VJX29_13780 [Candidatus Acidoferrales bacterium]|nr:hypothetical protein [Candidatus Acidoferrales bacterium]
MHSRLKRMRMAGWCALTMAAAALLPAAAKEFPAPSASPGQQSGSQSPLVRYLGTIKAIKGNTIALTTDEGPDVTVVLAQGARILRVEPGETNLSHAVPLQLEDLQPGDRVRVRGKNSADSKFLIGMELIAIKHLDIQAKREQQRADWQKRGIGGLVKAVDAAAGTVTISVSAPGGARDVTLHITPNAVLRRYAPDSVQFDNAKPAPLSEIKPGDQLRARGNRSADGSAFTAEEVVSGTFRNIAGTITSIDAPASTMVVMDLLSKKPVTVRISAKSQLRTLPPEIAMRLAMRLRGGGPGGPPGAGAAPAGGAGAPPAAGAPAGPGGAPGGGPRGGGDFQQIVNRLPQVTLADLQKGEAVMLVSTEGASSGEVTAITLLGGVEALLTASPQGSQAFTLSPWTLGGGAAAEAGAEPNPQR